MEWALVSFFERCIKKGNLKVTYASGQSRDYGDGTGGEVAVRFASRAAQTGFVLDPAMKFGESYMDGGFVVEKGTIYDYIVILKQNAFRRHLPRYVLLPTVLRLIQARL